MSTKAGSSSHPQNHFRTKETVVIMNPTKYTIRDEDGQPILGELGTQNYHHIDEV